MSVEILATYIFFAYLGVTLLLGWLGRRNMRGSTVQGILHRREKRGSLAGDGHLRSQQLERPLPSWARWGSTKTHGLGYAALPVGEMFFLGILFPTLGYKIWKFSRSPEVITLTDIVPRRYEERPLGAGDVCPDQHHLHVLSDGGSGGGHCLRCREGHRPGSFPTGRRSSSWPLS